VFAVRGNRPWMVFLKMRSITACLGSEWNDTTQRKTCMMQEKKWGICDSWLQSMGFSGQLECQVWSQPQVWAPWILPGGLAPAWCLLDFFAQSYFELPEECYCLKEQSLGCNACYFCYNNHELERREK
jgi:hypothetical protein